MGDWVIGPLLEIENLQLVIRQPGAVGSGGVARAVFRGRDA